MSSLTFQVGEPATYTDTTVFGETGSHICVHAWTEVLAPFYPETSVQAINASLVTEILTKADPLRSMPSVQIQR